MEAGSNGELHYCKKCQLHAVPPLVALLMAEMCSNIGIGIAGSAMRPIAEGECDHNKDQLGMRHNSIGLN
jgi:hypothetical protein